MKFFTPTFRRNILRSVKIFIVKYFFEINLVKFLYLIKKNIYFSVSYRPDLVDLNTLKDCSVKECNELAFTIIEQELRIPRVMSAKDSVTLENIDAKIYLNYLEQVCEVFRGEIPHVKHPKLVLFF